MSCDRTKLQWVKRPLQPKAGAVNRFTAESASATPNSVVPEGSQAVAGHWQPAVTEGKVVISHQ